MRGLTAALVCAPVVLGLAAALGKRLLLPRAARRAAVAAMGLTAICALALLLGEESGTGLTVEWLPRMGPMGLSSGRSSLLVVLATALSGLLVLVGTGSGGPLARPTVTGVTLLALAGANVAFLADHFLARYVGLEIVALCVALVAAIEVPEGEGIGLAWRNYLVLRVGDAGLLLAILCLEAIGGTLRIDPALSNALELTNGSAPARLSAQLSWAVVGFVVAAWVKIGGWPFHVWVRSGRRLSRASQGWLYATLLPSLGIYLAYRVTPLVTAAGPLRLVALWLGAAGAVLAALLALRQPGPEDALVYVGSSLGGLALLLAASGMKQLVWVTMLVLSPLRVLLFLAGNAHRGSRTKLESRASAFLFGLGCVLVSAFSLLITWWASEAGVSSGALVPTQVAAALIVVWAVGTTARLFSSAPELALTAQVDRTRWIVLGLLGAAVSAGGMAFRPLVRFLISIAGMTAPNLPSVSGLFRYVVSAPPLLAVLALSLVGWVLQRRLGVRPVAPSQAVADTYGLQEGLARAAQALHSAIEVGLAEKMISLTVRGVLRGARAAWALEHQGLEGLTNRTARAVVDGAALAHRAVEQGGLEGLLRRLVRMVLALSRALQRWHTGQLRRNLLWVPVALMLAVFVLAMLGR